MVSQKGMPYLVGNQELMPLMSVPDYPPNMASETINFFEVTFCDLLKECIKKSVLP